MAEISERKEQVMRAPCSICEEDGKVLIRLEMPGVNKENLDVRIDNDQLIIQGKRPVKEEGEYILHERRAGDFFQAFTLDNTVDRDKVEASMDKGILNLTLNLKEEVKPKKIEVKSS